MHSQLLSRVHLLPLLPIPFESKALISTLKMDLGPLYLPFTVAHVGKTVSLCFRHHWPP